LKKASIYCLFLILLVSLTTQLFAQEDEPKKDLKKVIQFSGLVVGGDSSYGVPGVHLYVPKAGRGTITSPVGYFSLATLTGDSIIIKSIGYKEKYFVIPDRSDDKLSVIIELMEDTLMLPVVEIFPYPTEKLFKEAFITLKLPETDIDNMHKNLNDQVMKRMLYTMDQDGSMNHKYYMQQQVAATGNKMMYPTLSLLNPFAWSKFIKSIKNGEHKNKAADYQYEEDD
jgi:hypothetical protein